MTDFSSGSRGAPSGSLVMDNADGVVSELLTSEPLVVGAVGQYLVLEGTAQYEEGVDPARVSLHGALVIIKALPVPRNSLLPAWSEATEIFSGEIDATNVQATPPTISVGVRGEDSRMRNVYLAETDFNLEKYPDLRDGDDGVHPEVLANAFSFHALAVVNDDYWMRPPIGADTAGDVEKIYADGTEIPTDEWTFDGTHVKPVTASGLETLQPFIDAGDALFTCKVNRDTGVGWMLERMVLRLGLAAAQYDSAGLEATEKFTGGGGLHARDRLEALGVTARLERSLNQVLVRRSDGIITAVDTFPQARVILNADDSIRPPPGQTTYKHSWWDHESGLMTAIQLVIRDENDLLEFPVKQSVSFKNVAYKFIIQEIGGTEAEPERTFEQTRYSWLARMAWRTSEERRLESTLLGNLKGRTRLGEEPMVLPVRRAEFLVDERGLPASVGELVLVKALPYRAGVGGAFAWDVFITEKQMLQKEFQQVRLVTRWVGKLSNVKDQAVFR